MASADTRYPILVDTDTLIAVANSSLWTRITSHVGLTTTNVCKQELNRHVENTRETAPEGSRPYRLHYGSRTALDALEDDETPLTQVTSVPGPTEQTPARNRSDRKSYRIPRLSTTSS